MRSWLTYIFILLAGAFMGTSCLDDSFENCPEDMPVVHLRISLPGGGSRVGGDYQDGVYNNNLDPETEGQRMIADDDIYVLQFDADGKLFHVVTDLTIDEKNGNAERTLTGHILTSEGKVKLVVLANLNEQDGIDDITPQSLLNTYIDKTEQEIYSALVYNYNYPSNGNPFWDLENRRLPMWGATNLFTITAINNVNCNLYRGVAKMGIQVDEECDEFILKKVYVYYANNKGYCAAPTKRPSKDEKIQFAEPEIPTVDVAQSATPITYTFDATKSFLNQIYLSEVDNTDPGAGKKELKVVVGGVYTGPGLVADGEISYYRIDMEDDKDNDGVLAPFDIIRNHSYIFNITKVENPGTPTPDEALDEAVVALDVVVEWEEDNMRGLPDQYTLTTDKSRVVFDNLGYSIETSNTNIETIHVTSDNSEGWELITDNLPDWVTITRNGDDLTVTVDENNGITRAAYFYVQTGNLRKQLVVEQKQPKTANCYIVKGGDYELIVGIKGNGNEGLVAEGNTLDNTAALNPAYAKILWETNAGLVTLKTAIGDPIQSSKSDGKLLAENFNANGTVTYHVDINKAKLYTLNNQEIKTYPLNNVSEMTENVVGGNALIGAFDKNGLLIWSWHIWVCPGMINDSGEVSDAMVEEWGNGYYVLDRNLGAIDNKPGVPSMGLLYQWGRKDPFIGAAYTNDDYNDDGRMYTVNYYENWDVAVDETNSKTINYTIQHPTFLIHDGLSSTANVGGYLWGSNKGLQGLETNEINLGSKTIYDPCPIGYRVPPVDAFVFAKKKVNWYAKTNKTYEVEVTLGSGASYYFGQAAYYRNRTRNGSNWTKWEISDYGIVYNETKDTRIYQIATATGIVTNENEIRSDEDNWNENLRYIPHNVTKISDEWAPQWYYYGVYQEKAKFYGFYMNYQENKVPQLSSSETAVTNETDGKVYYTIHDKTNVTWLPLSGAYDPKVNSDNLKFKDVEVTQGSSLSVNSFLWTNSSVTDKAGNKIPAAMFLHGAEDHGNNGSYNGRHIHALLGTSNTDNIKAEPQQAGAVRCIRDVPKNFNESNKVPSEIELAASAGSAVTITKNSKEFVSINDTWKVVDPGAPWVKVTPTQGTYDAGAGQELKFTALETNNTGNERSTVVKIKFDSEVNARSITVIQEAN